MDSETLRKLLEREDILGLGEIYWASVIRGNDRIIGLTAETMAAGKKILPVRRYLSCASPKRDW
ncbi:hypothetical protein M1O54_05185 [Dehalococcoidia bacterium]|nr:hypothetical protein [Dehalococcoidia bacterium]